jgi:Flp pilus assembly protein TadD
MARELPAELEALLRHVEEAFDSSRASAQTRATARVLPQLLRLAQEAPAGSAAWALAHRVLAERMVEQDPWRASVLARRLVKELPDDDGGWALLGLAQSLLGHHRYAVTAYRRALKLAPDNPRYLHNLGHLLDVAMHKPRQGAALLERAWQRLSNNREVIASYAHALVRMGEPHRARELMVPLMRGVATPEHHALYRFIVERDDDLIQALMREQPPAEQPQRKSRRRRHTRAM